MEAKDTVMSLDVFNLWSSAWHIENDVAELHMRAEFLSRWELAKLEHQAEISFKAGMYRGIEIEKSYRHDDYKAGIREVVRYVTSHITEEVSDGFYAGITRIEWQAKLKEWGID